MATFVESMLGKKVPSASSFENQLDFLVASGHEILADPKVRADLDRRLRTGSGMAKASHSCCHKNHHRGCSDPLSLLIEEAVRDLASIMPQVIRRAAISFGNVIQRGQAAGAAPMDASTAGFVRRQILTESLVRELTERVGKLHALEKQAQAREGGLFAFGKAPDEGMDQLGSDRMAEFMHQGFTKIERFASPTNLLLDELERLDALTLFEVTSRGDAIHWTTIERLEKGAGSLARLAQQLAWIPHELNFRNKSLLLQVVQNFQIRKVAPNVPPWCMNVDSKLGCVVPLFKGLETVKFKTADGSEIECSSGDLLILSDPPQVECRVSATFKRYYLNAFVTGPPPPPKSA